MALKAYREHIFKANITFEDDSTKEVIFRLPRNIDVYTSGDDNLNVNTLYTIANMAKPFEKPVQVEVEDGSILNITTLKGLVDLGVIIGLSDVIIKWGEAREEAQAEKDRLVKKSKSDGGSSKKDTQPAND